MRSFTQRVCVVVTIVSLYGALIFAAWNIGNALAERVNAQGCLKQQWLDTSHGC